MAMMASLQSREMVKRSVEIRLSLQRAAETGASSNRHMTAEEQSSTRASGLVLGSLQISAAVVQATSMAPTSAFPTCAFQVLWFKGLNRRSAPVLSLHHHPLQLQAHLQVGGTLAVVVFVAIHMQILHRSALMVTSVRSVELTHANALAQDQTHRQVLARVVIAAGRQVAPSVEQAMVALAGANAAAIAAGLQVVRCVE